MSRWFGGIEEGIRSPHVENVSDPPFVVLEQVGNLTVGLEGIPVVEIIKVEQDIHTPPS